LDFFINLKEAQGLRLAPKIAWKLTFTENPFIKHWFFYGIKKGRQKPSFFYSPKNGYLFYFFTS